MIVAMFVFGFAVAAAIASAGFASTRAGGRYTAPAGHMCIAIAAGLATALAVLALVQA